MVRGRSLRRSADLGSRILKDALSVASGLVMLAAVVPYVASMLRGDTKPSKATWLIWAALDGITLAGAYAAESVNWQMPANLAGSAGIALLSFRYGLPGWTRIDKVCFAGAFVAIALWVGFGDAVLAVVAALSAILIGSWPTFVSAWEDPGRESRAGWTLAFVSSALAVLAIPEWTLAHAAQPVVFLAIMLVMVYLVWVPVRCRPGRRAAAGSAVQVGGQAVEGGAQDV